jgi:alkylation response protein AidB-like acyl-CoA dehydrogenase
MSTVIPLSRPTAAAAAAAAAAAVPAAPSLDEIVETLAKRLRATAVERDRLGGHPAAERELIRASGLLTLTIPAAYGGQGTSWASFYSVLRRLAQADSALAHLFGFHHLQLAGVRLYGTPDQQSRFLRGTVQQGWFWGNALNPLDKRLLATRVDGGYVLQGVKSFASGSVGSDQLTVSAWHEPTQSILIGAVPTRREGVSVQADWDAFGQKQTDSGNVRFEQVLMSDHEVLQPPGAVPTPKATLRSQVAQLIMANLYLGIGLGAFEEARRYTQDESRPWFASGVGQATDDPFVQHRYGNLWLMLRPAIAVADEAAWLIERAFHRGDELSARERGEVAIAVAEAKVLSHRAGVEVSSQLFELTGARSTSGKFGLDRFWRNVRVHTLHDPVDYKLRDLGRHALTGAWPEPTAYS